MTTHDIRAQSILLWLTETLKMEVKSFQSASSDASFRRYFRVKNTDKSFIVMDAPPEKEDTAPFIKVAHLLEQAKVNVPHIYQQNTQQGFLLLEDFGSQCLLEQLNADNATALYQNAFDELFKLQSNPRHLDLPLYDAPLLSEELALFYDWFAGKLLGVTVPNDLITNLNALLINSALEQPQVCVHRDYHSRNLMVSEQKPIGVIDFQDAVIGAITYDLVSLLRDCYISWSQEQIEAWVNDYFQRLTTAGLIHCSLNQFKRWFDLMGLQRHLKAIGIFARLNLRDNKAAYLKDIPRTMAYVEQVCGLYPELSPFKNWLEQEILPLYQDKL